MTTHQEFPAAPTWAPRVPQRMIRRLYETDATGVLDEELIDEVGIGILLRVESILTATAAHGGRHTCPLCATVFGCAGKRTRDTVLSCPDCPWEGTWGAYHRTFKSKQLVAGGMLPFFQRFVVDYPLRKTARDKMRCIDDLIHRWHWEHEQHSTRPGGVNLIEGRLKEVMAFLNNLTFSEDSTAAKTGSRARWERVREENPWHGKKPDS